MQQSRRKIVALLATSAWLLQAWLGATHVHPHGDSACHHTGPAAACHAHEHHGHAHHGSREHPEPAVPERDEHDSSHCQICQLLAERPLPQATTIELAGGEPVGEAVFFAAEVPSVRPLRLFQSRAPPASTV